MQTDVCIRIINEKMNIKFLVRWVFDVPAIIAFGFSVALKLSKRSHRDGKIPYETENSDLERIPIL